MLLKGEAISGIWTLKYSAHLADEVWSIEVRTPYGKLMTAETRAPSPFDALSKLLGEGFDSCGQTSVSQRPPRTLSGRMPTKNAKRALVLGLRRIATEKGIDNEATKN